MKKFIILLILLAWAYQNPNHFVLFWGEACGKALTLFLEIFTLALKVFHQNQGGAD
jgi:hypothetical protein